MADNMLALPPYAAPYSGQVNALGPTPHANMLAAHKRMRLTPQEMAFYQTHLDNLQKGGVGNDDGTTSTLYQLSFDENGRTYNVPTIYGNVKLPPDEAIARARQIGLNQFPSYQSQFEAENRYQKMHNHMEGDTNAFLKWGR